MVTSLCFGVAQQGRGAFGADEFDADNIGGARLNISQNAHCLQWVIQWHMPHGPHVYWQEFYPYLGSCLLSGPLGAMEAVRSVRVGLPAHRPKGVARSPV